MIYYLLEDILGSFGCMWWSKEDCAEI